MTTTTARPTTTEKTSDRIRKQVVLRATPARVWRALSNAREFGAWFGAEFVGEFAPGATVRMKAVYEGKELMDALEIERMDPERLLAFRWHPFAIDPAVDYSHEPTTLVEIVLAPAPEGTLLTVTESGFDKLPADRRAKAFEMNEGGWTVQMENIARHVNS
jgi:uncharacterized protein YndB with AHSA1/START domain